MLILDKLNNQSHYTELEKTIANYFINIGRDIVKKSSRMIAKELFVSPSTISRFCQSLDYQGFNDFKEAYIEEIKYLESNFNQIDPNYPFTYKDRDIVLANKIATLYHETINDTLSLINQDQLHQAT